MSISIAGASPDVRQIPKCVMTCQW